MIILGIDPGTRKTGYGILLIEKGVMTPIDYGVIVTAASLPLPERYLAIFDSIEALIQKYQPDALSVETQYVHRNVNSALKVAMARSVVLVAAAKHQLSVHEYAPSRAKKSVVGKGRASKEQVAGMIKHLLKLHDKKLPEDAADALCLAVCHANTLRFSQQANKKNFHV